MFIEYLQNCVIIFNETLVWGIKMENKIDWKNGLVVALILFIIYVFVRNIIDPTPCYHGEVMEYNDGRSSVTCKTTIEEYDQWAKKHMSYEKYLEWRKSENLDYDE